MNENAARTVPYPALVKPNSVINIGATAASSCRSRKFKAENSTNAATAAQRQPDKLVVVTDTSVRAAGGRVSVAVAYAHLNKNLFPADEIDGVNEVPLNAPRHKASVSFTAYSPLRGLTSNLRVRWINGFPVHAGVFRRDVPTYTMLDAGVAWLFSMF